MADDYIKKYEEEYEQLYGSGAQGGDLNYDSVTGTYTNQQQPQQQYNNQNNQQKSYQPQSSYQQQNYNQGGEDMSYSSYVRGGSTTQARPTQQQQTFADDGFDLQDYYGKTKQKQEVKQIEDDFSMDDYLGKNTKPYQAKQQVFEDDGLSYSDYCRGGVSKPQQPAQQSYDYNQNQQQSYDQQYDQNQQYDYNNNQQQYSQTNQTNQQYNHTNQGYDNYDQGYNDNQNYNQQSNYNQQQPAAVEAEEEWSYSDFVSGRTQPKKPVQKAVVLSAEEIAYQNSMDSMRNRKQSNNQPQQQQQYNYNNQQQQNYQQQPKQNPYPSQQPKQQQQYSSYNEQPNQKQQPQTNEFMTEVAGDMAVKVAQDQLTYDNYEANKQHLTKENAETAYQGAKWANNKADELGIDKMAVASKVGSALWTGSKYAASNANKVDWSAQAPK